MNFNTIVEFIHLLTAVIWIGGMIFIAVAFTPALNILEPPLRGPMFGAVAKRFSIMAWSCVILLILTGLYKTPIDMMFNFSSNYTAILSVKLISFVFMILFGLNISVILVPKMNRILPKPGEKPSDEFISIQKRIGVFSKINLILGLVILFCIALLRT